MALLDTSEDLLQANPDRMRVLVDRLLAGKPRPTAVFLSADTLALIPYELTYSGFDAVKTAENHNGTSYARCPPARNRFDLGQNLVKARGEIRQDMVGIPRETVPGMKGGCRSTHQHCGGQYFLQARGG